MDPRTLIFALYLCVGGVLCLISLPLILGMVGPNPFYGLRVKRTLDDPDVWYPAKTGWRRGGCWRRGWS